MTKTIYLKLITLAVVFFGAGFFLGQSVSMTDESSELSSVKSVRSSGVSVTSSVSAFMIDYGDRVAYFGLDVPVGEADSLFDLTKQLAEQQSLTLEYDDSSEFGVFIKKIGERANGEDNKFWQYWVNDAQPMVASDKYRLRPGDQILWKFSSSSL